MTDAEVPVARIEQQLPAPPSVVYAECLDPDALSDWMCPRPARAIRIELDPTIGGRLRIDIEETESGSPSRVATSNSTHPGGSASRGAARHGPTRPRGRQGFPVRAPAARLERT
jgi:uncharacterized protein YndB with AHSA1/START domain